MTRVGASRAPGAGADSMATCAYAANRPQFRALCARLGLAQQSDMARRALRHGRPAIVRSLERVHGTPPDAVRQTQATNLASHARTETDGVYRYVIAILSFYAVFIRAPLP